jgi:probable HAF family extracellular repeat protein
MNIRMKCVIRVLVSMVFVTVSAAAQKYTITNLGALPGFTSSYADDNNNTGLVTGCSDNSVYPAVPCATDIPADAFLWSSSSNKMQNLHHLSGDDSSVGYVVNDSGVVVGSSSNTTTGLVRGFVWTKKSGMVDLGSLPGGSGYTFATAITSKGVIVGESATSNGDEHVVLWTKSQGTYHIHDEGHLPKAPYCYAYDINESQQVVGVAYFFNNNNKYHAFLWSKAAGWQDLPTLKGGNGYAVWLNNSGTVVGASTSSKYPNGVVVYWDSIGIHPIGTLPGGTSSAPGFISDTGQILGDSTVTGGASHAFIWTKGKGMQDLNNMIPKNSGWVLHHASSISNSGQIVGYGTINGVNQAFLLTPKP